MVAAPINEPSLRNVLVSRARAMSDGMLALTAGGGLIASVAIAVWQPPHGFLAECVAVCAAAFGVFGVAERELCIRTQLTTDSAARRSFVAALRGLAAMTGVLSGAAFLFGVLGLLLGNWIS